MIINVTPENLHLVTLIVCTFYFTLIVFLDSLKNRRLVFTRDYGRVVLDGVTLSTGITVGLGLFDTRILNMMATTPYYATIVALICTLGPIINVAQRYGRAID